MPDLPAAPAALGALDPAALSAPRWNALLAAGDVTLHVDDNAVAELDQRFQASGVSFERIHLLSADKSVFMAGFQQMDRHGHGGRGGGGDTDERVGVEDERPPMRRLPGGIEPSRPALVLREAMALDGRRGSACFAYLGSTGDGRSLDLLGDSITPDQLDRALAASCNAAPTVVVVSGCGTGAFAQPPMTRSNRLILTASTDDRHGFGCGPNMALTTFDECFIGALDGAATWAEAFDRTKSCVARREGLVNQATVAPASYIGALVASLPAPWAGSASKGTIQFRQGIGKFTLDGAPYYSTLKAKTRPDFEAYARAAAPKAMALTLSGTVAWASAAAGETPDDVDRLALQRCEYRSGGACILYARNENLAAAGPSSQASIHPAILVRSGSVDPGMVPFIRADQRSRIAAYLRQPDPKALALGPDTEAIGTGATATAALAECNRNGGSCVLYAENDRVVLAVP